MRVSLSPYEGMPASLEGLIQELAYESAGDIVYLEIDFLFSRHGELEGNSGVSGVGVDEQCEFLWCCRRCGAGTTGTGDGYRPAQVEEAPEIVSHFRVLLPA